MARVKRVGILTAGGDSPGLNAAIRGFGKAAIGTYGMRLVAFRDGFRGLAEDRPIELESSTLAGILTVGGTILGTSRDKPHRMMVDGVERESKSWSDWAVTTVIDTRAVWDTVWKAVSCHQSQITAYEKLAHLSPKNHEALWGWQSFYRVFSTVNGGRKRETDLFEGLRG